MKKLIFGLIIALLLNGCGNKKQEFQENIKTSTTPREVFIFAGKIQTNNSVNLASKISPSKVLKVNIDVGSTVKAGDPIIYLDTTDIENQKKQAEAKVNSAKAAVNKVQSKARPEDISIAQAAIDNDEKVYENTESNYNRIKKLYDGGYDTKQNMEQAEGALTAAKDKLTVDKENLQKLNNGAIKEDINVAQSAVNEAQTSVNSFETQLNNGIITSPISGTVSASNIHAGEIAPTGVTLVTIVNNDQLYIDGYVSEEILQDIKVGQEVVIKVSDMPDKRFKGEISVINPVMNSNSKNVVRVTLKEKNDVLRPGMFAQVGFNK